jgi:hypothetical protein
MFPKSGRPVRTTDTINMLPAEVTTVQNTTVAENVGALYRFGDKVTGADFPIQQVYHEAPEVNFEDVVEIQAANSKPDYFSVVGLDSCGEP